MINLLSTQDKLEDIMKYANAGISRVNSQLSVLSFISKVAGDNETNEFL